MPAIGTKRTFELHGNVRYSGVNDIGWIGDSDVADVTALALCGLVPHLLQYLRSFLADQDELSPSCPACLYCPLKRNANSGNRLFFKGDSQMKGRIVNCLYNCLWTVAFSFRGSWSPDIE